MKNKTVYGIFAVIAVVALVIGSVSAFGFGFGPIAKGGLSDEEKEQMQEFRDNIQTAVENNDYAEWKSLMESQLSEENFNLLTEQNPQMSEMRELMEQLRTAIEDGDTETAEELRDQMHELMPEKARAYGMGFKNGFGHGMMMAGGHCPFADSDTDDEE